MNKELVIDVTSSEITIALLGDKRLIGFDKDKGSTKFSVGDIYLGRVKKIMPGLNAAFVDVGYEKDAFLHYLDLGHQFQSLDKYLHQSLSSKNRTFSLHKFEREADIDKGGKISDVLSVGQYVLVQIAKEPISTKGPRLSSEISIAGRNLVLIPFSDKVSVSQKIKADAEKHRLKKLIQSIKPNNYGVIIRTVAEGKKVADLDSELKYLVAKWESSFKKVKDLKPPSVVIGELNRTSALLRDAINESFQSIYVNDDATYREVKEYLRTIVPDMEKIVKLYTGSVPIFDQFGIDKQIKSLFGKTVAVKSGAYLIIEHTEALHVVDVNSGNRSKSGSDQETNALDVNLASADEIARQLKLRDMGGIIVVDFIDMHTAENRQKLYDRTKEAMSTDSAKHHILPLSKFGLMQITRQRVRPEMNISTVEKCPTCNGTGKISASILVDEEIGRELNYIIEKSKTKSITIKVHPIIAAYLNKGLFSIKRKWQLKYKRKIKIQEMSSYNFLEFNFFDKDEIIL